MNLTTEEFTAFLDDSNHLIAAIVEPDDVKSALVEIRERVWGNLHQVNDAKSLKNLVRVEAIDFALKRYYTQFCRKDPDRGKFDEMLAWHERFVEAEIAKTIRLHVRAPAEVPEVLEEALASLWELRESFNRRKGPFLPWARGIAKNKARSRPWFDRRAVSLDTDRDRPLDLLSSGLSPEASAAGSGDTEGPPPQCYVEILQMVQEFEPHEVVAFLFNRYLDVMPAKIALEICELSLPSALAEVTRLIHNRYPEIAGIDTVLAPLAARVRGLVEKFGQYARENSSLEKDIGRWADKVHRSVEGVILQMGKRFLRSVCDLSAAAHEIVCFLWIRFLYSPPVALRHVADRELIRLLETFHEVYSRRELLSQSQVELCTSPLCKRLSPGRSLNNFAGSDLYASIRRWCDHVDLLIAGTASAERMLGYAYLMGSLTKGKSK